MINKKNQNLISRPPVVVVLGHVDHGKTSLLDYIRKTHVAEKESGGITQHIGAYEVDYKTPSTGSLRGPEPVPQGQLKAGQAKKITFIDTPGHEAFSAMRSRGAKVADIAILVVAADEGVKPQTKEAIKTIKKTDIPMIVAINKVDKPETQPEKIKGELAKNDVLVESLGGKIPSIEVSAKTGQGIEELLEMILLVAEMEKLSGDVLKAAEGGVIEAYLDSQKGPTATLVLREGKLKTGDIIATQSTWGRIKSLENFQLKKIEEALPSMPVIVLGLGEVPGVGERFKVFPDEQSARNYVEKKEKKEKEAKVFFIEPDKKVLNLILKTDVLGSLEAIEGVIKNLPQDKVVLRILKSGVGEISESDIKLAESSKAIIFGFRVKKSPLAPNLAERLKVKVFTFDIIYDLIQGIRNSAEKILEPEVLKIEIGKVKILAIFRQETNRQIIGGKVIDGEMKAGLKAMVERNKEKIGQGRIIQLQKNKADVDKALKGQECGILFESEVKIEAGDVLAGYEEERKKAEL